MLRTKELYKDTDFDIIVQAGQSNAEGFGFGALDGLEPYVPDERILYYVHGGEMEWTDESGFWGAIFGRPHFVHEPNIILAAERRHERGITADFSLTFARAYVRAECLEKNRKLLIIRGALGGSGFMGENWGLHDELYQNLCRMTDTALEMGGENRIKAVLWHQGEKETEQSTEFSDSDMLRRTHYYKLRTLVDDFRFRFRLRKVPFIAGDFCHDWSDCHAGIVRPISQAIQDVCNDVGYSCFVTTEDLESNARTTEYTNDTMHFSRRALYLMGERYFKAYKKLQESRNANIDGEFAR